MEFYPRTATQNAFDISVTSTVSQLALEVK